MNLQEFLLSSSQPLLRCSYCEETAAVKLCPFLRHLSHSNTERAPPHPVSFCTFRLGLGAIVGCDASSLITGTKVEEDPYEK